MTTAHHRTSTSSGSRFGRWSKAAAAVVGGTLIGSTLAGAGPAGAADETPPKPVAITVTAYPPVTSLSTPAPITITGAVTLNAPASGQLKVTLHKPAATNGAACSGTAHTTRQVPASATAQQLEQAAEAVPDKPKPGITTTLVLLASIKDADPEGRYDWQATFSPSGGGEVVKSTCHSTRVAHRDVEAPDPDNPDPDDPSPSTLQGQVTRYFRLMLDRAPTQTELTSWVTRLQAGTTTIPNMVAELRSSPEHVDIVDPVTRLYFAYFLRTPDADGLEYWIDQRKAGRSLTWISDFFSQSPEFNRRYGALNNAGFVELIYENILDRGGDDKGSAFWNEQLDGGHRSRGDVMLGFSESPEYKAAMANEVHIAVLHVLIVGRAPTDQYFESLLAMMDLGPDSSFPYTVVELAKEIID